VVTRVRFNEEFPAAVRVRGLTMTELARLADLSLATVSAAMHGRPVNMASAIRLSRVVAQAPVLPELAAWIGGGEEVKASGAGALGANRTRDLPLRRR
jgi:hypothetical protein